MNSGSSGTPRARPRATLVGHSRGGEDAVGWAFWGRGVEGRGRWAFWGGGGAVPTVDLGGGGVLGAAQRDQQGGAEPLEGPDPAGALERRNRRGERRKEVIGRHRIEHVADVVVGGNAADAEQGLAVRAA